MSDRAGPFGGRRSGVTVATRWVAAPGGSPDRGAHRLQRRLRAPRLPSTCGPLAAGPVLGGLAVVAACRPPADLEWAAVGPGRVEGWRLPVRGRLGPRPCRGLARGTDLWSTGSPAGPAVSSAALECATATALATCTARPGRPPGRPAAGRERVWWCVGPWTRGVDAGRACTPFSWTPLSLATERSRCRGGGRAVPWVLKRAGHVCSLRLRDRRAARAAASSGLGRLRATPGQSSSSDFWQGRAAPGPPRVTELPVLEAVALLRSTSSPSGRFLPLASSLGRRLRVIALSRHRRCGPSRPRSGPA